MKYYEYYQNGTNGLSGLSNDGNTCFLASATQILITIPSIKRLVLAQFFCFDMKKVDLKNFCIIFCDVWHMNHKGMNRFVLSKNSKIFLFWEFFGWFFCLWREHRFMMWSTGLRRHVPYFEYLIFFFKNVLNTQPLNAWKPSF